VPPNRSRDLVYLRGYLREKSRHPFAHRDWPWGLIAPLGFVGLGALSVLFAREFPVWMLLFFIPAMIVIAVSTAVKISWSLQQPRNEEEQREMVSFENAKQMSRAVYNKQINPFAARLLEGCAYHRARILAAVERPGWEHSHLRSMRDSAVRAADEAMNDAMAICTPYVGPGHSISGAWKDLAQDVVEGQLGDALKRLSTMLEADRPGEIVDRRKLPQELWPAYDIAVKLQKLASEVESSAQRVAEPSDLKSSSLDQVLSDLAAIKQAESELEGDEHFRAQG
jgi:hypothetical protein